MKKTILTCLLILNFYSVYCQKNYSKDGRFNIWYDKTESGPSRKSSQNIHIIHLSDIHIYLGSDPDEKKGQKKAFEEVCEKINQRFNKNTTYIIITGDLANSNDADTINQEFEAADSIIKKELNGFKNILLCPGNHDYGSGFKYYIEKSRIYFDSLFKNISVVNPTKVDSIPDFPIIFIGFNPMYDTDSTNYKKVSREGAINKYQIEELENIRNKHQYNNFIKIVYLHHPVFGKVSLRRLPMKIDNPGFKDEFKEENGPNIILCGHRHIAKKPFVKYKKRLHIIESEELYKADGYYVIEIKK